MRPVKVVRDNGTVVNVDKLPVVERHNRKFAYQVGTAVARRYGA